MTLSSPDQRSTIIVNNSNITLCALTTGCFNVVTTLNTVEVCQKTCSYNFTVWLHTVNLPIVYFDNFIILSCERIFKKRLVIVEGHDN